MVCIRKLLMLFSFHVFVEVFVSALKICCGINFIFINSMRLRLNNV